MNATELNELAKKTLSAKRYRHCEGVAQMAKQLALRYGLDPAQAELAGWLHDLMRETDETETVACCRAAGLGDEAMYENPMLLHGPLAALRAEQQWGIHDQAVLAAVRAHTLGDGEMAPLTCVLYLADGIEPNRSYPGVEELRALAQQDLYLATERALAASQTYLKENGKVPHPQSASALERVRKIRKETRA